MGKRVVDFEGARAVAIGGELTSIFWRETIACHLEQLAGTDIAQGDIVFPEI